MQVPLEIVFEGLDSSPAVEDRIRGEARKLERHFERVTSCRVVFSRREGIGKPVDLYETRLHLTLPGQPDIVVSHNGTDDRRAHDPYATVRDAFAAAIRQLESRVGKKQKHHPH